MPSIGAPGRIRFRDARGHWIRSASGEVEIFDEIGPRLTLGPRVTESAVMATLDFYADNIEQWMQENAQWEDRTGAARDGLRAEVLREKNTMLELEALKPHEYGIVVYHTVTYGVYLEIRWNGRYAILQPAIEHWGPFLMQEMEAFG